MSHEDEGMLIKIMKFETKETSLVINFKPPHPFLVPQQTSEQSDEEITDIIDTDEIIQETLSAASIQPPTFLAENTPDLAIKSFLRDGCGYKLNDGRPCSMRFTYEQMMESRLETDDLTRS